MRVRRILPIGLTAPAVVLLGLLLALGGARCEACFSIVAGKDASVDGYVILAHNEDDHPPQIVHHHKVPRKSYRTGEKVALLNGGRLDQVGQTWAYIWSRMPGMLFSDSYINEWGVAITSDNCPSREDKPEITEGGIGYMLRRLVAERAKTSREGVLLAGELVERFGYIDSGRTYIICDPGEGWLFCVVNGKHWLAQRVADDRIAMVANTYTVRRVDLSDRKDFLASSDIIEYAVKRGWYDPEKDGAFDFAAVYANPASASSASNFGRQWSGLNYVNEKPIAPGPDLPFSVVPKSKVGPADIMKILRHDNQGKTAAAGASAQAICETGCPICSGATQTSFVVQLRRNMPLDVGIVYWACLASPRTSFYIPFYFGMSDFPLGFSSESERPSADLYESKVGAPFRIDPLSAFWTFSNFCNKMSEAPAAAVELVKGQAGRVERSALAMQESLEETARRLYQNDRATAMQILANYSKGVYLSSLEAMDSVARLK
ncbi:MAG: C69 family dipeptidase [Phycisphaerales bacterium]|nr:MAG: C69 family dipeptidase [Phycisphaerales bacterium]